MKKQLLISGSLMLLAATAGAQGDPVYLGYVDRWNELKARYAAEQAAVVLDHNAQVDLVIEQNDFFTRITEKVTLAVFDVNRAEDALNRAYPIYPGSKIKTLRAWSHQIGTEGLNWSKDSDVYVTKIFGNWKEARVAVPGIGGGGICGVQLVTERDGIGFASGNFIWAYPVEQAMFKICIPSVGSFQVQKEIEFLDQYFRFTVLGDPERTAPVVGPNGLEWSWKFSNLPPRYHDSLMPAAVQPKAAVYMSPRFFRWQGASNAYATRLVEMKPPKELLDAARSGVAGGSLQETVEAVAACLDDPTRFRLLGGPRDTGFSLPVLKELMDKREGDAFSKAVLAHLLLRELGIDNNIVLAASRYRTDLDWEYCGPGDMNAALIYFPSAGPGRDFWDVADPSVPIGVPGPDLYAQMFLLQAEDVSPIFRFQVPPGDMHEFRAADVALSGDGRLTGSLDWRFATWPSETGFDPWDRAADPLTSLKELAPERVTFTTPAWKVPEKGPRRCTAEKPAELTATMALEATPSGENGWEIKPLFWPAPRFLPAGLTPERKTPVLIDRNVEMDDSLVVHSGGLAEVQLPEPVHLQNKSGGIDCVWQRSADGVVVRRRLTLKAQTLPVERLPEIAALSKAWEATSAQTAVFR